ncbi:MAG: metallophosphoesterase [Acidimicrobiales bacterium]
MTERSGPHAPCLAPGAGRGAPGDELGVHLLFGSDPATSVVVCWGERPGRPAVDDVMVGPVGGRWTQRRPTQRRVYRDGVSGELVVAAYAVLDGLMEGSEHAYALLTRAGCVFDGSFRTAPARPAAFSFTACGDIGTDWAPGAPWRIERPGEAADPQASVFAHELVDHIERAAPLFHLALGDLAYSNLSADPPATWRRFFANAARSAARRPWMPCPGNHENEPLIGLEAYRAHFVTPANGSCRWSGLWYAFTVGSVRFVSLSGEDLCVQDAGASYLRGFSEGEQVRWLRETLAHARCDPSVEWIVVAVHQTAVSTAEQNGGDLGLRRDLLPVLDEFGVDLVLTGHEHCYERSRPLRGVEPGSALLRPRVARGAERVDGSLDTARGAVHLVLGCGGAAAPPGSERTGPACGVVTVGVDEPGRGGPARRAYEPATWSARRSDGLLPFGFARFDVTPAGARRPSALDVLVFGSSGRLGAPLELVDRFRLRRDC